MSGKYKIGDYEFQTYEEYLAAQEDVKKIDYITKEVDVSDVDVAVRLYTLIRNKEIVFHSRIGVSFSWYLSDIIARSSKDLLEEKREKQAEAEKGDKLKAAGIICILAAILCLGYYGVSLWQEHLEQQEFENLQDMQNMTGHAIQDSYVDDTPDSAGSADGAPVEAPAEEAEEKERIDPADLTVLKEYRKLYRQNADLAGWLSIAGTEVDYPVMQTGERDPDYYLHHDFEKQESVSGSLFLDARNDFVNRDTNLIIYGHNMKNGTMFGSLKKYMDKSYWKAHNKIKFNTVYEKADYTVVAVCLSKVNYEDDYTFRYYNFLNAGSGEDFNAYLANIRQLSVFDENIDISYGDELLTLSTCNSYIEDGRLFLVAKRE